MNRKYEKCTWYMGGGEEEEEHFNNRNSGPILKKKKKKKKKWAEHRFRGIKMRFTNAAREPI